MHKIIVGAIFLFAFVLISCDSSSDATQQSGCGNPNDRLKKVAFELDGVHWDLDSLRSGSITTIYSAVGDSVAMTYSYFSDSLSLVLFLNFSRNQSGSYPWSSNPNGYGCSISIDSIYGNYHLHTMSQSGTTDILVHEDSLFGVFCGVVKDSLGRTYQVSNGRFYYD